MFRSIRHFLLKHAIRKPNSSNRTPFRPRLEQLESRRLMAFGPLNSSDWTPVGPAAISDLHGNEPFKAGRVQAAAPHPTDTNTMYIAADDGGIWKTNTWNRSGDEGGPIWIPLTDNQRSLDFAGYHPLKVLKGTTGKDIILGSVSGVGGGVLRSMDGGIHWTLLGNKELGGDTIVSVVTEGPDLKTMYVADWSVLGGVWKTTDYGATWTNTTKGLHSGGVSDLVRDSKGTLYAGMVSVTNAQGKVYGKDSSGIYVSTDNGNTWKLKNEVNNIPNGSSIKNFIRLEVAPSSLGTVYATMLYSANELPARQVRFVTMNSGAFWSVLQPTPGDVQNNPGHVVLSVDPLNSTHIIAGDAYSLYESYDVGFSWFRFDREVDVKHPDQTVFVGDDWVNIAWDAANHTIATGDRDLYAVSPADHLFNSREGNLQITEFYSITLDPNNVDTIYGVAQDQFDALQTNGSMEWHYTGGGGEVGRVLVDPTDSNYVYVSNPPSSKTRQVERSSDGGKTWQIIKSDISIAKDDYALAYATEKSFTMDPNDPKRLLIGTTRIYETTNARDEVQYLDTNLNGQFDLGEQILTPEWTAISDVLSPSKDPSDWYITALAIAPSNPNVIYAGTRDGHIWLGKKLDGGGWDWTQRDQGLFGKANGRVWEFHVDPVNDRRLFAITNDAGGTNVWYLDPQAASWQNISGSFSELTNSSTLYVDWGFSVPALYVGTGRGVYHSVDFGAHWTKFGNFMPNTAVNDLQGIPSKNILAAGTYGRGAWEILIPPASIHGNIYLDFNRDAIRNGRDQGVQGALVFLDVNGNNQPDANEYRTLTDASGNYSFPNVPSASYTIRTALPPESQFSTVDSYDVTTDGTRLEGRDFGVSVRGTNTGPRLDVFLRNVSELGKRLDAKVSREEDSFHRGTNGHHVRPKPITVFYRSDLNVRGGEVPGEPFGETDGLDEEPMSISGTVFNDTNENGQRERTEQGTSRITVFIDANANGRFDRNELHTTTDITGAFAFMSLPRGTYLVSEVVPSGKVPTTPRAKSITLVSNTDEQVVDFGLGPQIPIRSRRSNIDPGPEFRGDSAADVQIHAPKNQRAEWMHAAVDYNSAHTFDHAWDASRNSFYVDWVAANVLERNFSSGYSAGVSAKLHSRALGFGLSKFLGSKDGKSISSSDRQLEVTDRIFATLDPRAIGCE